ncbi:hypothetical protein AWQ21_12065 [Picosynechococcus sp. PCC 7003]|uniref:PIN domain-containing protein n=1 Tax=Picosynechococcus sp. PCC 7003 TaxID=374981 RepID=UPI0008108A9F|nr:hypothetical protein AWQ21_12065 [Picosynechococcus sp. PCC 7003]
MKILVDTNIILDFLLQREPFFQDAELLFQAITRSRFSTNSSNKILLNKSIIKCFSMDTFQIIKSYIKEAMYATTTI